MIYRGDCYWHDLPLPGTVSTGAHCAFVLSSDAANVSDGRVLLASSHRQAQYPWAFFLVGPAHYRHSAGSSRPAFDTARPIGVEQMVSIPVGSLGLTRDGALSVQALDGPGALSGFGAASALRVQFALPGYRSDLVMIGRRPEDFSSFAPRTDVPQHSIWEMVDDVGLGHLALVVSNDKHNTFAQHVQVLEVRAASSAESQVSLAGASDPVTLQMSMALRPTVGGSTGARLVRRVRDLVPGEVKDVQALLQTGLGLV